MKLMKQLALTALLLPVPLLAQGPLDPPAGPPVASMKTLQEIWDRVGLLETQLATAQADLTRTRADLTLVKADNQLLTGLFSASASSLSLPWNIVTVDSANSVGTFLSMAFSPAGQPAIAYYKISGADLKFASYNGSTWEIEEADSFGAAETSLAFDPSGQPAISAWNIVAGASGELLFVTRASGIWETLTVDSGGVGKASSLAFGHDGRPAIAYSDILNKNLKFARYNGSSWAITTVDNSANDVGSDKNSLAFGPDGQPAIAYWDRDSLDLKFARYNGSTWALSTVDSAGSVGSDATLKFGPDGQPAIAYRDITNNDLKLARYNGTTWTLSTPESAGSVGSSASLAFGPDGQPAIAHYDGTNGDLRFTRYNGSTWTSTAVDTAGIVGSICALSFGPDGQPAISYYDSTNEDLKFARKGVFKPAP